MCLMTFEFVTYSEVTYSKNYVLGLGQPKILNKIAMASKEKVQIVNRL